MSEINIRDLKLDETGIAGQFFHEYWRPDHIFFRNHELLLWMYHDSPAARPWKDKLTIKAAFDTDLLIGFFAYIPFIFNHYGIRKSGCHLSAWWVKPEYRRGSLGLRLLYELQFNMGFSVCISGMNTPIAEKIYENMGWQVLKTIPRKILPLDRNSMLAMLSNNSNFDVLKLEEWMKKGLYPQPSYSDSNIDVKSFNSFHELINTNWDQFYWEQLAPGLMEPAREIETLLWRYENIPIFSYHGMAAYNKCNICGLIIYRIERVKNRSEKIIRLVNLTSTKYAARALIFALIKEARQQDIVFIDYFSTHPFFNNILTEFGFLDACLLNESGYVYPHLFQPLDETRMNLNTAWWVKDMDMKSSAARQDFLLMKGDYEFDRPN